MPDNIFITAISPYNTKLGRTNLETPGSRTMRKVNDPARHEEHELAVASALVEAIRAELEAVPRNILGGVPLIKGECRWKES